MRKLLRKILRPLMLRLADHYSSAPVKQEVFRSLSRLLKTISNQKSKRGIVIDMDIMTDNLIIFSDQHKGNKDGGDDFKDNEPNYISALNYYLQQSYVYINLGDAEELWKYTADKVIPKNIAALKAEANFQFGQKYYRTFGNHDLLWKNKLDIALNLHSIFEMPLPVYEGIVLRATVNNVPIKIFLTHGHQGDKLSDNNAFSSWVIAHLWGPVQRYLSININTPSNDSHLRNKHNRLMYEWSSRKENVFLVTGHTHKPVFASGRYSLDVSHTINTEESAQNIRPTYFNTGCCCYNDGDITGIEIADGSIRLIKWHEAGGTSKRSVLEEKQIIDLISDLKLT